MKISKLIVLLEEKQKSAGDIDVMVPGDPTAYKPSGVFLTKHVPMDASGTFRDSMDEKFDLVPGFEKDPWYIEQNRMWDLEPFCLIIR